MMIIVRFSLLLVCLLVWTNQVFCRDFLMGKVLTVDSQNMEILLAPRNSDKMVDPLSGNEKILVRLAKVNNLPKEDDTIVFPGCVFPGSIIRVWGEKDTAEEQQFIVTDIRGCRGKGCSDPTGVRSRLLLDRRAHERHGIHGAGNGSGSGRGRDGGGGSGGGGGGGGGR